uniref:Putative presegetalin FGTHGLPAP1 n=1 Tax=Gypsophila vaccaria TaxID=39387 RepID=F6LNM4_GYPVA|nr:putative presegetalin FGTHGLPAP1 [Gypsophila vaccaria]
MATSFQLDGLKPSFGTHGLPAPIQVPNGMDDACAPM